MWSVIQLFRLENNIHPVLGIIAGFSISQSADFVGLGLAVVAFICVHTLATVWNDLEDEQVDILNGRQELQRIRASGNMMTLRLLLGVIGLVTFVCLSFTPMLVNALLLACIVLSWLYNSRPVQASKRPISSMVLLWLTYGVAPVLIGLSYGAIEIVGILFVAFWSLSRSSLSLLKDFKDAPGDAISDKRTFLLVYGKKVVAHASFLSACIGLLGVAACVWYLTQSIVTLILLLIAYVLLVDRFRLYRLKTYRKLDGVFRRGLQYQIGFDVMVVICLSISVPSL